MRKQHLIIVDDVRELLAPLERRLHRTHGDRYAVYGFTSANDALEHVTKIDQKGDILALVATDEKMPGMQGHELLRTVGETHPTARRVLYSGYTDYIALREACNNGVHRFVQKATPNEGEEGLYPIIQTQLKEFERQPRIELQLEDITIKLATTLYERRGLYKCRYRNYLEGGLLAEEDLTDEQNEIKEEWDEYDGTPNTRYIVARINGAIIGGTRIIDGSIPMETGTVIGTGERFSLDNYRSQGIQIREVSRLVIDNEHRGSLAIVLTGLFRMIAHLTRDHDFIWCSSREEQIRLYQAIGFELIHGNDGEPQVIEYKLRGKYYPMLASWTKAIEEPDKIENFMPHFYARATRQLERVNIQEWIEFSKTCHELAEETGYFKALYVAEE